MNVPHFSQNKSAQVDNENYVILKGKKVIKRLGYQFELCLNLL